MRELESVRSEKDAAIQRQQYELAAELRDRELKLQDSIEKLEQGWQQTRRAPSLSSREEDIAEVVGDVDGHPGHADRQEESARLLQMEAALHERVIGQDEAIDDHRQGRSPRARRPEGSASGPSASFIFLGPTGVGKTELAKALAEFMFGSEDTMIKIDMSEFMEKHTVARLVGAPPGYVGYDDGGQLTETVRRKSYSVILLDEIEKAHPDVFNMLLQILDDGSLTDAKGRTVDFRNTIIIMTSNVGADLIRRDTALGFVTRRRGEDAAQTVRPDEGQGHRGVEAASSGRVPQPHRQQVVFHALARTTSAPSST